MGGVDCNKGEEDEDGVDDVDEHCIAAEGVGLSLMRMLAVFLMRVLGGVLVAYPFSALPVNDYEG